MPFTFYEFFAGGGMARMGLGSEWRCTFANEWCEKKARSYRAYFGGGELKVEDVANLGVEDLPGTGYGEGYGDYNDMIFSIQLVPEPGGLTVFGVGVLSLAGYSWRRRKQLPPLAAA